MRLLIFTSCISKVYILGQVSIKGLQDIDTIIRLKFITTKQKRLEEANCLFYMMEKLLEINSK